MLSEYLRASSAYHSEAKPIRSLRLFQKKLRRPHDMVMKSNISEHSCHLAVICPWLDRPWLIASRALRQTHWPGNAVNRLHVCVYMYARVTVHRGFVTAARIVLTAVTSSLHSPLINCITGQCQVSTQASPPQVNHSMYHCSVSFGKWSLWNCLESTWNRLSVTVDLCFVLKACLCAHLQYGTVSFYRIYLFYEKRTLYIYVFNENVVLC